MSDFWLPPEWATQRAVWLSWPQNKETWTANELQEVEKEYGYFVGELSEVVEVNVLVLGTTHQAHVESVLKGFEPDFDRIVFHQIQTNDAWMRDHGPDFVWNKSAKQKCVINWGYNSWGGKYPPFDDDNAVPDQIADRLELTSFEPDMILEGGSIEVNGRGDLLTTKSCLLNPNRNPQMSQEDIENHLRYFFGVEQIIWLESGIQGDDTDGHIDDFARFVSEDTVMHVVADPSHPDHQALSKAKQELTKTKLSTGQSLRLIELPMPDELYYQGEILPCSYANFLITNQRVFVPVFECPKDEIALSIIQNHFKDRKVIGIPSKHIIIGLGSLHCLSKHEFDQNSIV